MLMLFNAFVKSNDGKYTKAFNSKEEFIYHLKERIVESLNIQSVSLVYSSLNIPLYSNYSVKEESDILEKEKELDLDSWYLIKDEKDSQCYCKILSFIIVDKYILSKTIMIYVFKSEIESIEINYVKLYDILNFKKSILKTIPSLLGDKINKLFNNLV